MTKVGQTKTDTAETCLWCVGERLSGGRVAEQPAWRIGGRNWCGDLPGVQKYMRGTFTRCASVSQAFLNSKCVACMLWAVAGLGCSPCSPREKRP